MKKVYLLNDPNPIKYAIATTVDGMNEFITAEATRFDDSNNPQHWAIRHGNYVMSKNTGLFDYEESPSSRDHDFIHEYRFPTMETAINCFKKNHIGKQ